MFTYQIELSKEFSDFKQVMWDITKTNNLIKMFEKNQLWDGRTLPGATTPGAGDWVTSNFYAPANIDIWIKAMEILYQCIPDMERPEYAVNHIDRKFRVRFKMVLEDAQKKSGPIQWSRFKDFVIAFDCKSLITTFELFG